MTNTILINADKSLQRTTFRTIYQKENRADVIQFLISKDFFEDVTGCNIMLQVVLPTPDEEHGTETTGKLRYMTIDEELYKDRYRMELPITTVLTNNPGEIKLWFLFFNTEDPEHIKLIKTGTTTINIMPTIQSSSSVIDDDESYDVLANMQNQIDELKDTKLDKTIEYDEENGTVQFMVNGEPVGTPIQLDNEIAWSNWTS